jgi:ADP-dependent phosphofructokinase/glucokinase
VVWSAVLAIKVSGSLTTNWLVTHQLQIVSSTNHLLNLMDNSTVKHVHLHTFSATMTHFVLILVLTDNLYARHPTHALLFQVVALSTMVVDNALQPHQVSYGVNINTALKFPLNAQIILILAETVSVQTQLKAGVTLANHA